MRIRNAVTPTLVVVALLTAAGQASARQGPTPPLPKPKCQPCVTPQQQLEELERRRAALRRDIARADANIEQLKQEGASARADAAEAKKIVVPPELAGSSNTQLEQRLLMNSIRMSTIEMQKDEDQRQLREVEAQIDALRDELNRCNQSCTSADAPPAPFNSTGGVQLEPAEVPRPRCEPCETPAEELKRLEEERRQLSEFIDKSDAEIRELESANTKEQRNIESVRKAAMDPKYRDHQNIADEMIKRIQDQINGTNSALDSRRSTRERARQRRQEVDERLQQLRDELDKCNSSCPITNRTLWYAIGGGAVALGTLTTLGGGSTPMATAPPPAAPPAASTPQPQPQPQPPAQPAPPAVPVPPAIDGEYACTSCTVTMDNGGHNPFIRLCEAVTGVFRALQGSISISHPAPFVAIAGDFNTSTGAFDASGRGTVAGFPNVGVRGQGTADAVNGRITFDYTMGAGGELPGGRPIIYRLTLQKR